MQRVGSRWLLALWIFWAIASANAQDWNRPPNVVVLLYVQPDGTHFVSWALDKRIPHDQVRERARQFTEWSQRMIAQLEIVDDSLKRDAKPNELFTTVSFATSGLVNLHEGTIDLTPIVRTFADMPVIHIYTALPKQTNYAGYTHYATPHLEMWAQVEPRLWRTIVYVNTPEPKLLEIPLKRPQEQPQATPKTTATRPLSIWAVVLLMGLTLLVGIGVFSVVSYLLRRQNATETVQPDRIGKIGG